MLSSKQAIRNTSGTARRVHTFVVKIDPPSLLDANAPRSGKRQLRGGITADVADNRDKSPETLKSSLVHAQAGGTFLCGFTSRGSYKGEVLSHVQLLGRYAEQSSEEAFAELVWRHVGLVFSVAFRQVNGDPYLARISLSMSSVAWRQLLADDWAGRAVELSSDDYKIRDYCNQKEFILVTKDSDFSRQPHLLSDPPKVVCLGPGNAPTAEFVKLLQTCQEQIEAFAADQSRLILVLT